MRIANYMVSISWGAGGWHHFSYYTDSEEKAIELARSTQKSRMEQKKGKKGAKPTVYVWKQIKNMRREL